MVRTFTTHRVRKQEELTGCLWDFIPCEGENAGKCYRVSTPSVWETYPNFGLYRGEGIYKRVFTAGGNLRFECKGVSHTATVYLDGKEIAHHYNAYTAFDTIVRDVPMGEHVLEIKADNRFSEASSLHIPNDYMTYGGVNRPVVLEQLNDMYIEWIHVTPIKKENVWTAKVEVKVHNLAGKELTAKVNLFIANKREETKEVMVKAGSFTITTFDLTFENVEEWSTDNPVLYEVTGTIELNGLIVDDFIDRFGFRQITIEGKKILLNNKEVRIKGVCRHEDHPHFGCALPYQAMCNDLNLIRDLGANSVRTAHYPNDEIFLDLCDEMGILVWEENHARGLNLEQMKNPNFEWQAEQVIEEMIRTHYNHPSIYIWGILNECASEDEYGKECYKKQFDLIRNLDVSRPCSFASCRVKSDICLGLPDVVSYNIYPLWYHDTPVEEYLDDLYAWIQQETEGAGKPFLITEIGAGGMYGYRSPYKTKWSEEYQETALDKQLTAVLNYPDCSGVYIWQFCDIRISEECFAARPRTMNNKGIVDEYRRPKLVYETVKRIFEEN